MGRIFTRGRFIKAIAAGVVISLVISLGSFNARCAQIRERVVRLHVLAHSDSAEDQALKLQVRDAIVTASAGMLDGAENASEALALAREHLPAIEAVAQETVYTAGYDYAVTAEVVEMYFTTRQYEQVTLPAGLYEAVRITIGEGGGKNWWCVVFPPMCVSAATQKQQMTEVLGDDGLEDIVTQPQKYEVRLKLVELWEEFWGGIRRK